MSRADGEFVRGLLRGLTLRDAATAAGVPETRARGFLESVAHFAEAVGGVPHFETPDEPRTEPDNGLAVGHEKAAKPLTDLIIYTDGASNGNPGPSGAGGVILTPDGTTVEEFREHIGRTTNNVAEYEAVRIGLGKALAYGAKRVVFRLDSELVANQLSGRFKVKDSKLIEKYLMVEQLLSRLEEARFEAIPRAENSRADRLAQAGARMRNQE